MAARQHAAIYWVCGRMWEAPPSGQRRGCVVTGWCGGVGGLGGHQRAMARGWGGPDKAVAIVLPICQPPAPWSAGGWLLAVLGDQHQKL